MDIVCFSSAPWDAPVWTNKQHVTAELAKRGHRVLYVEPGVNSIVAGKRAALRQRGDGIFALKVAGIASRWWWTRSLSAFGVGRQVNAALRRLKLVPDLALFYDPERARQVPTVRPARCIYDMVDHHPSFPMYAEPGAKRWIDGLERRLIAAVDCVAVTCEPLGERAQRLGASCVRLVPNAATHAHADTRPLPLDLPRPVVGVIATIDPSKIDLSFVQTCAAALPDFSFALIGPFAAELSDHEVRSVRNGIPANVHFLGPCKAEETVGYAAAFDVCFLPAPMTEHTRHVFPLKIYDYLASGRPIVARPLPALCALGAEIEFASSAAEAVATIRAAVARKPSVANTELAFERTWSSRVDALMGLGMDSRE